jgi:hypothetical protein
MIVTAHVLGSIIRDAQKARLVIIQFIEYLALCVSI